MDFLAKFLLVELLPGYSSVCQRVDGINHEVGLGVIFLLHSFTMAVGPNGFHYNLGSWYLFLDVALQNAGTEKSTDYTISKTSVLNMEQQRTLFLFLFLLVRLMLCDIDFSPQGTPSYKKTLKPLKCVHMGVLVWS